MLSSESRSPLAHPVLVPLLAPLTILLTGCGGPDLIERLSQPSWTFWGTVVVILDLIALFDLLGDETRSVMTKVLWALLIIFFPVGGVILYFLFGRD